MPELPEVETVANGVNARIRGEQIMSAWFSDKPEPFKTSPTVMAEALKGCCIDLVRRVGKTIVFDLTGQRGRLQWLVHLGMTGRLLVSEASVLTPLHCHGILSLSSRRELRFVDARRFGRMGIYIPDQSSPAAATADEDPRAGYQGTGREPLEISAADLVALLRGRKTAIKAALLNQRLLHGVGNIYADEGLFRAGIRPRRLAARLTRAEVQRLHTSLRQVLIAAIALGGSSVSDYVDADGVRGFFQLEHRVYMRTGQPCLVCQTPIKRIVVAGRGTHYCPQCQR